MWTPPPDPDKPDCPYLPGFEVEIKTHTPPPPFGGRVYASRPHASISDEWIYSVTQTKHILTYPPLETPPPAQLDTARLEVTKSLATGNARGAQVLLCSIVPQGKGMRAFTAVAKIYDPLYYSFISNIGRVPINVSRVADEDYSKEAASYECLCRANQAGSFAPAFFGSWTFSLPISHKQQRHRRHVRLILIEYLPGVCIKDLFVRNGTGQTNALHLSEEYRLRVLAILLDGVVRQHHAGIDQRDLAPRNVMLVPPPDKTQLAKGHPQRVVLIDYNIVTVWEMTKYGKLPAQLAKLPPNPMKRFWRQSLSDFDGWVPSEWYLNQSLCQKWLRCEFGGEKKALYEPIDEELELDRPLVLSPPANKDKKAAENAPLRLSASGASVMHSDPSKKPSPAQEGKNKFEVVPAPAMLPGERYSPQPGTLFTAVCAAKKKQQAGQS